ncbi:hypothetical protein B0I37DRAFT_440011 [Chaetomium sp. MPI-CAGE-AT-0009]|nr:hypothetical protein B0I37DRAFT_440011 [Chaetomium sp. MPI-CAGE-AT-0009]
MSTRNPGNAGNSGNAGNTGNATGNTGTTGNARNTGNTGNTGNATGTTGTARTRPPIFSAEIEVYIKIKPNVEASLREKQRAQASIPDYWRGWDLDLSNDVEPRAKSEHRRQVTRAVKGTIDSVLGEDNGWDSQWFQLGPGTEPRKWWGIEIVTPPMSVSKQWQLEINMVFEELGKKFDFWTKDYCGFHVHVSPGATSRYTLDQLLRTAKGAYFWEHTLSGLVQGNRGWNEYAMPNHTVFGSPEYETRGGWTANLSHNFCPVNERGTIEFRRQAGVASAMSAIRGILLAVTLHISALRYDFDRASSRNDHPDEEELIRELAGCIKKLPETCHGTRFVHWLKWCREVYRCGVKKRFTEPQINIREEAFRKGLTPPNQIPYKYNAELPLPEALVLPSYALAPTVRHPAPEAQQGTTLMAQGRGGASSRGGASTRGGVSGRGGGGQSSSTVRPTAAGTPASAGAPPRPPATTRTGGSTTRLPERPAAASSSNTNTTAPTAGQRRRREGDANP